MITFETFSTCLAGLGGRADRAAFESLLASYTEAGRHYHDTSHIEECLRGLEAHRDLALHPQEIEAAIWFHDAVYDTRANDNEQRSADLAQHSLCRAGVDEERSGRVVDMILATKTHHASTSDCALMVDIDLAILGTRKDVFEQYDANIRCEYAWVPRETYRPARAKILRSFLERDTIYQTPRLRELYEEHARANLRSKLAELER